MTEFFLDLSLIEIIILRLIGLLAFILVVDYVKSTFFNKSRLRRRWRKRNLY